MTLGKARLIGHRFRRQAWGWKNKLQYLYFDGQHFRKLSGKVYALKPEDLAADDWEISNPIRNKLLRSLMETAEFKRIMDGMNE
jgi:hypothetical protein